MYKKIIAVQLEAIGPNKLFCVIEKYLEHAFLCLAENSDTSMATHLFNHVYIWQSH